MRGLENEKKLRCWGRFIHRRCPVNSEPPTDDELLNLPNFIATPHIGAGSEEARWRMGVTAIEGLTDNFLPEPGMHPFEDC